jgi:hypothetical protein
VVHIVMMADILALWCALRTDLAACISVDMKRNRTENSEDPLILRNETIDVHTAVTCLMSLEMPLTAFAKVAKSVYGVAVDFPATKTLTLLYLALDTTAVLQNLVGRTSIGTLSCSQMDCAVEVAPCHMAFSRSVMAAMVLRSAVVADA